MSLVQDEMLTRLMRMFGEPRTSDVEGYTDEFERALGGFSRDVIIRATNELIDNADKPFWPTVGEANAACKRAVLHYSTIARMNAGNDPLPDFPPPTPDQVAFANQLVFEASKKMSSEAQPKEPLPDVGRETFERFRDSAVKTFDGRGRHQKRYSGEST